MITKNILPLAILAALCCASTHAQDEWDSQNVGSDQSWRAFGSPDEAEESVQDTIEGFRAFDKKWGKYTDSQVMDVFSPESFARRLRTVAKKHEALRGRKLFLGAFNQLIGAVQGATSAVQGIANLVGTQTSEALVGQFTDRGFKKFKEKTTITVTSGLPTKFFEAFMKDQLRTVVKVPSKHNDGVDQVIKWGMYTESNSWNAAENTFDINKGGKVKNFQVFLNRNTECEHMNIVLVKTDITFKLAPDVFVISKSKATFGGAFSTTKLHWKKNKAALKAQDLQFVSEFFINLGMTRIKQSQEVAGFAARDTQGCGGKQPPQQTTPHAQPQPPQQTNQGGLTDQEAQCYLNRYPDLQKAFGANNIAEAKKHWLNHGKKENRDRSCSSNKDEAEDMYDFGPEEFYDTEADDESVGYPGRRYVNPQLRPTGRPNFGDRARGIASAGLHHSRNFFNSPQGRYAQAGLPGGKAQAIMKYRTEGFRDEADEENVGGYLYDEDIGGSWDENDLNEDEQVGWKKDITKPFNPINGGGQWRL